MTGIHRKASYKNGSSNVTRNNRAAARNPIRLRNTTSNGSSDISPAPSLYDPLLPEVSALCRVPAHHGFSRSNAPQPSKGNPMLYTVLIIVLILVLIGALPTWPHSANWGYYPSGGLGTILVIIIIVMLLR